MAVTFTYVNPPIPVRGNDWSCSLTDDDEDAVRGWGATKSEALNDLLDNLDADVIAKHFRITTRFIDPCRGPEYGHWVAESGLTSISAADRDSAIADLAYHLVDVGQ